MKRAQLQLSLKEMFVWVTLLCALFAGLGAGTELVREARQRCEHMPGFRGGHPYWSTPEAQQKLAAAKIWHEGEKARRLRLNVGLCSCFWFIAIWLAVRLVALLRVRRLKPAKPWRRLLTD